MTRTFRTNTTILAGLAASAGAQTGGEVPDTWSHIAKAACGDRLTSPQALHTALIDVAQDSPPQALAEARAAWLRARVP